MNISLKENFSKKQRDTAIRYAWKTMGLELFDICQCSKQISPDIKIKITQSICEEYARQEVVPFLSNFACGDFNLNYDETNAISLADVISEMKPEVYEQLIKQIKHQEEIAEAEDGLS